uniref:Phosphoenolpyruvate carboxylase n=1 Tax=Ignisphaera aggregans TaxID=334771 RepID=A0A7J2U2S0_9CREN
MEPIPKLMCTQHPDATVRITAQDEVDEAVQGYTMFGCDEVMSDYEGKLTPYAQPKDIVLRASRLGIAVGEKYFVTPRIPNPRLEDVDRVALSIEASLIANYYSYKHLNTQAVKWIILPMTEEPETVRFVQRFIMKKMRIYYEELGLPRMDIQLIPLVEDSNKFLEIHRYVTILYNTLKDFDANLQYMRVFLGKSDAAVKSGHIASALALMYALYELSRIDEELDMDIQPIIGMGSPTFRGGINNPKLVEYEVRHYQGYKTVTIQSAVRYDVPFSEYQKVSSSILQWLGKPVRKVDAGVLKVVRRAFESYRKTVSKYLDLLVKFSSCIPSTRDRVTWKEYGRVFGLEDKLLNVPRAIVYTATWYVLGLPPIFLDTEFITESYKNNEIDEILNYMPYLIEEWEYEAQFFVPSIASKRLDEAIVKKVSEALDYMGIKPEVNETYKNILELNPVEPHVIALAKIRGFLG